MAWWRSYLWAKARLYHRMQNQVGHSSSVGVVPATAARSLQNLECTATWYEACASNSRLVLFFRSDNSERVGRTARRVRKQTDLKLFVDNKKTLFTCRSAQRHKESSRLIAS